MGAGRGLRTTRDAPDPTTRDPPRAPASSYHPGEFPADGWRQTYSRDTWVPEFATHTVRPKDHPDTQRFAQPDEPAVKRRAPLDLECLFLGDATFWIQKTSEGVTKSESASDARPWLSKMDLGSIPKTLKQTRLGTKWSAAQVRPSRPAGSGG